jgi:hypothetical protein
MTMTTEHGNGQSGNRWRLEIWGGAAFLLLLPFVAMQFTGEVNWDAADFITIGVMLLVACGTYELAARASGSTAYRAAVGLAVLASFLLVWINLAVGIIGNEDNDLNGLFVGVLLVAVVGTVVARGRAGKMVYVMTATAIAQALVAIVALVAGHFILVITAGFVAMWLVSGALFRRAAQDVNPSA